MAVYSCRVMVEYLFEVDTDDHDFTEEHQVRQVEEYACHHFDEYPYGADVYSVDVSLEVEDEEGN